MRRADRERREFGALLAVAAACDCCRLGLADEGEPYIVPLNFGYEAEGETLTLYFHSARTGRKLALIRGRGRASFEMDTDRVLTTGQRGCDCTFLYRCAMGTGEIQVVEDEEERRHGLALIMEHYTGRQDWAFDPRVLAETAVLRLRVDRWSCKEHTCP